MTYHSRPNIDQLSRDLIEDLGLPLPAVNTVVVEVEDHMARVPVGTQQDYAHLGRAS